MTNPTNLDKFKEQLEEIRKQFQNAKIELSEKEQSWKSLNDNIEVEIEKRVKERLANTQPANITDLQNQLTALQAENEQYSQGATVAQKMIDKLGQQKQTLEDKIKDLQSKRNENKETAKEPITWK